MAVGSAQGHAERCASTTRWRFVLGLPLSVGSGLIASLLFRRHAGAVEHSPRPVECIAVPQPLQQHAARGATPPIRLLPARYPAVASSPCRCSPAPERGTCFHCMPVRSTSRMPAYEACVSTCVRRVRADRRPPGLHARPARPPRVRRRDDRHRRDGTAARPLPARDAAARRRASAIGIPRTSSPACVAIGSASSVADKAIDRTAFDLWIETQLAPTLSRGDIVILDNLAVHKSAKAARILEDHGAWFLFLPPYSRTSTRSRWPLPS